MITLIIILLFFAGFPFGKIWVHLIEPFDQKPTISISEIASNPSAVREHSKKLCSWLKREELRNPSIVTSALQESACRNEYPN